MVKAGKKTWKKMVLLESEADSYAKPIFLASEFEADSYANLILRLRVWSGPKNTYWYHSCKSQQTFVCGDGARVICSFARVIQRLGFGLGKLKPRSTTTAMSGAAPSALCSALDSSIQPYAH